MHKANRKIVKVFSSGRVFLVRGCPSSVREGVPLTKGMSAPGRVREGDGVLVRLG